MRYSTLTFTCLCVLMAASPVLAKDKKPTEAEMQAMMETYQKLATPGEPHKQLTSLAGSWTTHTKSWMDPSQPPTESNGTAEMKALLDGRFLQQEFNGEMMDSPSPGSGSMDTTIFVKNMSPHGSTPWGRGSSRWKAQQAPMARPSR